MIHLFVGSIVIMLVLYALCYVLAIVGVMLFGVVAGIWMAFCALLSFLLSPWVPSGWDFQSALKRWWGRHGNKVSIVGGVLVMLPGVAVVIFGLWTTFIGDPFPSWFPGRARQEANPATTTPTPAIRETGERKSVEPDASSVRPTVPEPPVTESPVDVAMTEGQLALLRQDVLAVAAYEDWDRVEHLPGHLAERAGDRLKDWQLAAGLRNREGQFMLGLYHAMGQPGGSNRVSGIEMLKAATDGMPEAGYWLGLLYVGGIARLKDYAEAEKWLLKAAWQGHVRAQYTLGILYGDKRLAMQNPDRSLGWLAKAAQQGLPEAQRDFDAKLREENRGGDGKLPPGFTRIELGADGKIRVGR